jgi:hypothetical protein
MSFGFRKSIKIAPGMKLNLGKKSMGISMGTKGLRYSVNSRTGSKSTLSIPGTGMYYSSNGKKYKSTAYKNSQRLKENEKQIQKNNQLQYDKFQYEEFLNKIDMIKSIHKECDEEINWEFHKNSEPPFITGQPGPNEIDIQNKINNYKPSIFKKTFKFINSIEKDQNQLNIELSNAKEADDEAYKNWENLKSVAIKILSGDIDTYLKVIDEMSPLDDLSEYGSEFEFFIDNPTSIEVEFSVNSDKIVPKIEKKLSSTGKLIEKQMSKSKYYDILQDYICSVTLRVSRDLFALLPLSNVLVHVKMIETDSVTGHYRDNIILSVNINKNKLYSLDLDNIDCSDSMDNFPHNMKFLKTKGFQCVEKLQF